MRLLYVDDQNVLSVEVEGTRVPLNAELLGRLAPDLIGPPGPGVPDGGTLGQVLTKASSDDQDAEWSDPAAARLADDSIEDRHVQAGAAIALSKLATDPLARANHTGTQRAATISDFDAAAQAALVTGLAGKADLVGGLVPTSQIPALALADVSVVASQVEQLALTAQEGDVAIRSDQSGRPYIHNGGRAGSMADWTVLDATAAVASVNGQTGTVVLSAADVSALSSADGSVASRHLAAALKPSGSAGVGDEAVRRLGTGTGEAAPGANAVARVAHGATAGTARPSGYALVVWIGSVDPTNRATGDLWVRTA